MQIKRHWLLVETMPFEYFFSGVIVYSGSAAVIKLPTTYYSITKLCLDQTRTRFKI